MHPVAYRRERKWPAQGTEPSGKEGGPTLGQNWDHPRWAWSMVLSRPTPRRFRESSGPFLQKNVDTEFKQPTEPGVPSQGSRGELLVWVQMAGDLFSTCGEPGTHMQLEGQGSAPLLD